MKPKTGGLGNAKGMHSEFPRRPGQATKDTKMAHDASQAAQDGPKAVEKLLQDGPRCLQEGPNRPQEDLQRGPEKPKSLIPLWFLSHSLLVGLPSAQGGPRGL
eukprot:8108646-Pyramimonas_sp.AAC.1